jgi:hypothetical protein
VPAVDLIALENALGLGEDLADMQVLQLGGRVRDALDQGRAVDLGHAWPVETEQAAFSGEDLEPRIRGLQDSM